MVLDTKSKLSNIDLFSLVSAGIGILADAITITSILVLTNSDKTAPFAIWLISLISILITVILIGFFCRKFFVNRTKTMMEKLNKQVCQRLNTGAQALSITIGVILGTLFAVTLMISINPFGTDMVTCIFGGVFFGGVLSIIVSFLADFIALTIYRAFDLNFYID